MSDYSFALLVAVRQYSNILILSKHLKNPHDFVVVALHGYKIDCPAVGW
jgi:hypothetical protein